MFSHRYRYLFIAGLAAYTFLNTVLCNVYFHFNIAVPWYYSLLTIFFVTFFTWEGNRLIEPLVKKWVAHSTTNRRYLAIFLLTGMIAAVVSALVVVWMIGAIIHKYDWSSIINPLKLNIIYAGLINLFFHLLNTIVLVFNEYKNKREEAETLRQAGEQAQIQLLKNQVNPHFLFNNLNVLSAMVIKDNPDANKFIEEFSRVYRYILNNQEKELVSLQTELEFVEPYVYLLKKRFAEGLNVSIDIPEHYTQLQVVPAALQLLVENAIKHNIVSRSRPLTIRIHGNGNHTLVVSNNLQLRQTVEDSTRIGLQNINKRYLIISGRNVEIIKTNDSFQVLLPLLEVN